MVMGLCIQKYIPPKEIVYTEEFVTKADAAKREIQITKWSRTKKEALIEGDISKLKKLSKKKIPTRCI